MEREGRRIVACADAETAWGHLQREEFDVLVTDMNLPGSSGSDLARRWLKDDAARHVILYSGFDYQSHLASMASMGSNVRAVPKEDFEKLDQALARIGDQL